MSLCQGADLDQVVGEDAVSAPGAGSCQRGQFGAVPSVASLEVVDPAFASGPPFDLGAERFSMFELPPGGAGSTGSWETPKPWCLCGVS